jgi:DNA-binding NarL/FixJ family response regulator
MSNSNDCKIILVEPSPVVSAGIQQLLDESYEFTITEHLTNLQHLKGRLLASLPDMFIINPVVLDYDKRFALRSFLQELPNVSLVALVYTYVEAGVLQQFNGIIEINDNFTSIEITLRSALSVRTDRKEFYESQDLTEREIDVLIEVAKGLMNKEIADKLNISVHTVISHRKNISRKTGIKSVSGLTVYAMINKLINKDGM